MSTTATTTATTAAPAKRTLKLCAHAINGGCRSGDACPNVHPLDLEFAKAEFGSKKTLNLCGFHPNCTHEKCTYLHVTAAPRAAAPAPSARLPPAGKTPARTPAAAPRAGAKTRTPASGGRGGPSGRTNKAPAQKESARAEPESLQILHRIRGKINALERTRLAFGTVAKEVKSVEAQEKADQAQAMQDRIRDQLAEFARLVDEYLLSLGATLDPEETPSEEDTPDDDGTPAGDGSTA